MKKTLSLCSALLALGIAGSAQGAVRDMYLAATDGWVAMPDDGAGAGAPLWVWIRGFVADTAPGACAKSGTPATGNAGNFQPNTFPNLAKCNAAAVARLQGQATLPAPIIDVNVGDDVFVTLSNIGNKAGGTGNSAVAGDPHTIHLHGLKSAAQNDGFNESAWAVPIGYAATYYFKAERPGTFMYHCHVEASEHVQMGMYGALIIRPTQWNQNVQGNYPSIYTAQKNSVYGGANNDVFDDGPNGKPQEYIMLLTEIDPVWHEGVLTNFGANPENDTHNTFNCPALPDGTTQFELKNNQGGVSRCIPLNSFNPSDFLPRYWLVNGRAWPDTLLPTYSGVGYPGPGAGPPDGHLAGSNNLATYATFINVRLGDRGAAPGTGPRFLVRVVGMGFTHNAHHFHGFLMTQVGEDAEPLPLGQQHPQQTLNVASGKTYDVIVAPDCLSGYGQDSVASHTPGEYMGGGVTTGPVGSSAWENFPGVIVPEPPSSALGFNDGKTLFPGGTDMSVQIWPVHSHYDYTVTNSGVYPGGAISIIRAVSTNGKCS
ncbi:MAG TPA: multicopper oxidase domain-containing protein [Burkholderiaceae bacterium]|nr:multicopper oxidase domain-containing protein [Burkholderiaceae bacterium]